MIIKKRGASVPQILVLISKKSVSPSLQEILHIEVSAGIH